MYCKHCGANIHDGSVFCKKCGGQQTADAQQPYTPPQQQAYTPPQTQQPHVARQQAYAQPKKNVGLIVTVCVLGGVALIASIFAGIKLTEPSKTRISAFEGAYEDMMASTMTESFGDDAAPDETAPAPTQDPAQVPTQAPAEVPTQAPAEVPTQAPASTGDTSEIDAIMNAGLVQDIEGYLHETWWATTGHEVANPYAEALAPGYPVEHDVEYAEVQYIFDADAQTVTLLYQMPDGSMDEIEDDYIVDPQGYYLYAFYDVDEIDGIEYYYFSAFAVSGDTLYMVSAMADGEVSNLIELEPYGP